MAFTLSNLGLSAADRATLSDFLDSWVEHGRPVLFVGAGMSRHNAVRRRGAPVSAEIKDWAGLVAMLRERLAVGDDKVLKRLPADYLRLAQLHETQFQRVRLLDAVEEALASKHFEPGPAHARLKRFEWEAIITTNYDDLLERTFADSQTRPVTKVVWDVDLTRRRPARTLLLVKMHGDLEDRDSIVLTEEDYRCYEQGRPGVALKVKQLLLEHPSLFIGFSLSDPNVGAIEGWIRDTTGQLKLPSVVLVHSEPLIAERDMWARRGIKLVHVPQSESLARVLDALDGERQRRAKAEPVRQESGGDRAMDQLIQQRNEGWEADAAKLLVRLADGSHETEFASAVRYALQGGVRDVPAESIQRVLEALTDSEKRLVLLRAQAHGVLEAGGSGRKLLDVEQHLLEDPLLSPSERGSILVKRAIRALRQGKLQAAREGLLVARALDLDASTSEQLQKTLRGVLLRIGDDSAIREELLESPLPEDSFAYARRGADALLTRGRLAATRWYGEALKYARTGDEKTAALQGLQACDDPADWTRGSALDEERMAILPEERPRTERVYDLQSAAGRKLLAMYRVGRQKASHEPDQAIEKLREALEEADDMGWPKSVRANLTTAADGLALEIVGLLLANEPTSDQVQQALAFSIERGLLGIERHFDGTVFDRLVSEPSAVTATRALLQVRDEAPFMKRSRALLRSALLPLLPDEQISTHIEACIDIVELNSGTFFEKSSTESHLELLAKHYESFPPAGAAYMLGIFSGVLRSDENGSSLRATWLRVPICDWVRTGVVKPADPALRECVSALLTVFARGLVANDPFVGRVAFSWLEQFVEAGVLLEAERQDFVRWLDSELADSSTRSEIDRTRVFELAHARAQLGSWTPPPEVRAVFMNGYAKLKNSTAVGRWLTLVGTFAATLSTEEKAAVVRDVFDYADRTLSQQNSTFGPFPEWAAEAISQAATSGILPTPDALKKLQELGRMYPEVLALAVDLPGIDVEAAEQNLLAAVAVESEDVSLLRWCQDLPPNRVSLRLERIALGGLHARDGRSRQLAYWSCAALAKNGNLSASGRIVLAEAISKFGVLDRDWHVRGAAVAATARILDCIEKQGMLQVLAVAAADPIARVRRSAGFLQLAISASEAVT